MGDAEGGGCNFIVTLVVLYKTPCVCNLIKDVYTCTQTRTQMNVN